MPEEVILPEPEDFEFSKENLKKLLSRVKVGDPELWDRRYKRIQEEILFSDVVEDLTGKHGHLISCPFHGADSTPSFYVYPPSRGNMGYCFGCSAPYYSVNFVAKYRGMSKNAALEWLEKHWNLPPLESEVGVEEEQETVTITFEDLAPLYVNFARKDVMANKDYELAEEYLRIYFEAAQEEDPLKQVKSLASVIGSKTVARVKSNKLRGML
jgi:DNA primase